MPAAITCCPHVQWWPATGDVLGKSNCFHIATSAGAVLLEVPGQLLMGTRSARRCRQLAPVLAAFPGLAATQVGHQRGVVFSVLQPHSSLSYIPTSSYAVPSRCASMQSEEGLSEMTFNGGSGASWCLAEVLLSVHHSPLAVQHTTTRSFSKRSSLMSGSGLLSTA